MPRLPRRSSRQEVAMWRLPFVGCALLRTCARNLSRYVRHAQHFVGRVFRERDRPLASPQRQSQTRREAGTESRRASRPTASLDTVLARARGSLIVQRWRAMRTWASTALVLLTGVVVAGGPSTKKDKENHQTAFQTARARRESPTVLAVRKTRDSIVTVKVQKPNARKDTIGTGIILDERGYIVT